MISVCVPVYKAHGAPNVAGLAETLESALDGREGELVVALNGISAAAAGIPAGVRTADLRVNRGVAPGWNAAARIADGETLVFCNDDVELGAGSLARLQQALEQHPDAVVGPMGSSWDISRGAHTGWVRPDDRPVEEMLECDVVSGFLFACTRDTWEAVDGFDEFYAPASFEEVDFCTAVRARGGRCLVVSDVEVAHEWGVSRRQPPWARARWDGRSETWRSIHRRNRRHFVEKWAEAPAFTEARA